MTAEDTNGSSASGAGNQPGKELPQRDPAPCSDADLRLLVDSARDFAMIFMDPHRHIVRWSPGAEQILGWSEEEALGQDQADIIFTPEDREHGAPEQEQETALREGRAEDERWHLKKDGSRFWASGVMVPLFDPETGALRGFGKILRDLTERRRWEEELQEGRERYRTLFESIDEGFCLIEVLFDEAGTAVDYRFLEVNPAFERHTGLLQAVGKTVRQLAPELEAHWFETYGRIAITGEPARFVNQAQALEGRWFDVYAFRVGEPPERKVAILFTDITQRVRAERERASAQEALERAFEREQNIADTLQRPLTMEVAGDTFPGLRVATRYEAALEEARIGGDFFDAFALPNGRVALAVGDASGKGLQAAARAIQVKEVLRAFTREPPHSPAPIVARLNDYVCDTKRLDEQAPEGFLTLIFVVLDPSTGEASVVSAGAEPPLTVRENGSVEALEIRGLPLGVHCGGRYSVTALRLAPGDTLLLTTDGITEAREPRSRSETGARLGGAFLGPEGLERLAREAAATPSLEEMAGHIVEGARAFGGGSFGDDVCLLLARRL